MSSGDEDFDLTAHAYVYKNDGVYPEGCTANHKRSIRRKASKMIAKWRDFFDKKREGEAYVAI